MAIVQISRITQRKGLQSDLPQLSGAEFGWSIDERRLFIGNGTLEEGAPIIGNTEILTEFSNILEFQTTYTYKGLAAGYEVQTGATSGSPVTQSLQTWLDQFATVKDFGATGDGVTDDTDAINRALYQLYCREVNPQIRRSLFFPAGVYKISSSLLIPPYATLIGEGENNSIIQMSITGDSALVGYVARTVDSLQQTGVNIGNNGAVTPQYVTVQKLAFKTLDPTVDVFLVEDADHCHFQNVQFSGPLLEADLDVATDNLKGVGFASTVSLTTNHITFDQCEFTGLTYGIATDQNYQGVTVSNSKFNLLYSGIYLTGSGTGFEIVHNQFDNIYYTGVDIATSLNATGHNIFYDVGNHFEGAGNPYTYNITFLADNNVSVGDMFERDDTDAANVPRINYGASAKVIATVNGKSLSLGSLTTESTRLDTLLNNQSSAVTIFTTEFVLSNLEIRYKITRDVYTRYGTFVAASNGVSGIVYTDDYSENGSTGIILSATQSSGIITFKYTSTNTGLDADIDYSISYIALPH
jgi:hypothetical protein